LFVLGLKKLFWFGIIIMQFVNMDVWKRSRGLPILVYREVAKLRDFGFKE
jgi:hypothetical protein